MNVSLNVPVATVGSASGPGLSFEEVSGLVQFTPVSSTDNNGVSLRVPYYLVPRSRYNIDTDLGKLKGTDPSAVATVTNKKGAVSAGTADFYAWGIQDGKDGGGAPTDPRNVTNDVRAVGVQSFPLSPTTQLMIFAVNTWKPWSSQGTERVSTSRWTWMAYGATGSTSSLRPTMGRSAPAKATRACWERSCSAHARRARAASGSRKAPTDGSIAELPVFAAQLCRTGEPCPLGGQPAHLVHHHELRRGERRRRHGEWHGDLQRLRAVHLHRRLRGKWRRTAPTRATRCRSISAEFGLTPALGLMVVSFDNQSGANQADLIKVDPK